MFRECQFYLGSSGPGWRTSRTHRDQEGVTEVTIEYSDGPAPAFAFCSITLRSYKYLLLRTVQYKRWLQLTRAQAQTWTSLGNFSGEWNLRSIYGARAEVDSADLNANGVGYWVTYTSRAQHTYFWDALFGSDKLAHCICVMDVD